MPYKDPVKKAASRLRGYAAERLKRRTDPVWHAERKRIKREFYAKWKDDPSWKAKTSAYMRDYQLRTAYNITLEEWSALFEAQGNCCACCKSETPRSKLGWSTDHNHVTGEVRGILCSQCNVTLGKLGDTAEGVRKFAAMFLNYLEPVYVDGKLVPWEPNG